MRHEANASLGLQRLRRAQQPGRPLQPADHRSVTGQSVEKVEDHVPVLETPLDSQAFLQQRPSLVRLILLEEGEAVGRKQVAESLDVAAISSSRGPLGIHTASRLAVRL